MTIDKAIGVLVDYKMESAFEATTDFTEAIKLGIEALTYCNRVRNGPYRNALPPLPGEAKNE